MARLCATCQHRELHEINKRLLAGEGIDSVARRFGLAKSSVNRHRRNHLGLQRGSRDKINGRVPEAETVERALPFTVTKTTPQTVAAAASLLDDAPAALDAIAKRIDAISAKAEAEGSLTVALQGLGELRRLVVEGAKLKAGVPDVAVNVGVQVNVLVPELARAFVRIAEKHDLPAEAVADFAAEIERAA